MLTRETRIEAERTARAVAKLAQAGDDGHLDDDELTVEQAIDLVHDDRFIVVRAMKEIAASEQAVFVVGRRSLKSRLVWYER